MGAVTTDGNVCIQVPKKVSHCQMIKKSY